MNAGVGHVPATVNEPAPDDAMYTRYVSAPGTTFHASATVRPDRRARTLAGAAGRVTAAAMGGVGAMVDAGARRGAWSWSPARSWSSLSSWTSVGVLVVVASRGRRRRPRRRGGRRRLGRGRGGRLGRGRRRRRGDVGGRRQNRNHCERNDGDDRSRTPVRGHAVGAQRADHSPVVRPVWQSCVRAPRGVPSRKNVRRTGRQHTRPHRPCRRPAYAAHRRAVVGASTSAGLARRADWSVVQRTRS